MRKALRSNWEEGIGTEVQNRKHVKCGDESIASCCKTCLNPWAASRCLLAAGREGRSQCWEMSGNPIVLISPQWGIALSGILLIPWASSSSEHPCPLVSLLGSGCSVVVLSSPGLLCPLLGPRWEGRRQRLAGQRQGWAL